MWLKPTKGIAVDCSVTGGNPAQAECRGVNLETGEVIFDEQIGFASNNIAEYLAIAYGASYLHENNLDVPIYSDSQICINWVKKNRGCRTNIFRDYPQTAQRNPNLARLIEEAEEIINTVDFKIEFWNKRRYNMEIPADYGRK